MDIRGNLVRYLDNFEYEKDPRDAVMGAMDKLCRHSSAIEKLEGYVELYRNGTLDYEGLSALAKESAAIAEINEKQSNFIHCVSLADHALPYFEKKGLGREEWYDSMIDFKWKMRESYKLDGVWGINPEWFKRFFTADRIAFGRLQYNLLESERTFKGKTVDVTKGQTVVTIHIPSDDRTPFSPENRLRSYERAEKYYRNIMPEGKVIFRCGTWLLNTLHLEILPEGSNIRSFLDDFEMDPDSYDVADGDLWRIFYVRRYDGNPASLPEESSLMRAYKRHLINGGHIGKMVGFRAGSAEK